MNPGTAVQTSKRTTKMVFVDFLSHFIRDNHKVLIALGAGILIGTSISAFYHRLNKSLDLATLAANIETLKRDVEYLRKSLDERIESERRGKERKKKVETFYSGASSGEEDEFEEAIGGSGYESATEATSADEFRSVPSSYSSLSTSGSLFEQVDRLFEGSDGERQEAYQLLDQRKDKYSHNAEFLWRFSKACYMLAQVEGSKGAEDRKKSLVYAANEHACKALQLNPNNSSVHKWCAISLGSVGDYESTQVRIQNGWKFKEHIQRAIELNPRDPSAHYLLGRWCFGVYMLTWVERQLAATFVASPPSATIDEALTHFLEADKLNPDQWKENLLFIAKCYIEKRDYYTAVNWLDKAEAAPCNTVDDRVSQQEVDNLLYKYGSYRR